MDPIIGGALIGGAVNLGTSLFNQSNARNAFKTRYQDTVKDMRKAGLNPALAYGQGGGNPQTAPLDSPGENISQAIASAKQTKISRDEADARIAYTRAQTSLLNAQARDLAAITAERAKQARFQTGITGERGKQAVSETAIRAQQATQAVYGTTIAGERAKQAVSATTVAREQANAAPFRTETAKQQAIHARIVNELASRLDRIQGATEASTIAATLERNLSPALKNELDRQNIDIREVAREFSKSTMGRGKPTLDMIRQWLSIFLGD